MISFTDLLLSKVIIFLVDPVFFNLLKIEDPIKPHPIIEI